MPREKDISDRFLHEVAIGVQSTLGLSEFLKEAQAFNVRAKTTGKWRSGMWDFLRFARGHPDLRDLDATAAVRAIEAIISSWDKALEDPWKYWFPESDDPQMEIFDGWQKIKVPYGSGNLSAALADAERSPYVPAVCPSAGYGRFISLAGHLQVGAGSLPIFLPCQRIATVLGVSAMSVSSYRRAAINASILELVRKGRFVERKADEFLFRLELFDLITLRQRCDTKSAFNQERQEKQDTQDGQESQDRQGQQESQMGQERQEGQRSSDLKRKKECQGSPDGQGPSVDGREGQDGNQSKIKVLAQESKGLFDPDAMQKRRIVLKDQVNTLHRRALQNATTE